MNSSNDDESETCLTALFDCLASEKRRYILGQLHEQASASLSEEELAAVLAAENQDKPPDRVTDEERQQALYALHHVHLPKLDDAELITRDAGDDSVALSEHPAYQDASILDAIHDEVSVEANSLDALFRGLADGRRRTVLDVLSHQYQPIRLRTLARDIASTRRDHEDVESILRTLRHVHLPRLQEAELVEYDTDEGTVTYEGHPLLCVPWMHSELGPGFRETLTDDPRGAEIRTIDGREKVVSCGQSLCEEAEEELFLMFTATGLLEAGCFTRIEQAAERGVDVYLGTVDPTVREFVRERAPEITLWEPETNWLDLPVQEKNVGRLVFADREAIMIGTLEEESDDGVHEERAIFGEGADNTLVVLLRQMLASQLEAFDDESADAEALLSL